MLLPCLIFRDLCIVQVERIYLTYHKRLDARAITLTGDGIRLIGNTELCRLIVELLHQKKMS